MMNESTHPHRAGGGIGQHPAWAVLKESVEAVRACQTKDGSIDFSADGIPSRKELHDTIGVVVGAVEKLTTLLPHDADYHHALAADLRSWADGGFGVPDFLDSLVAFRPASDRRDRREHLVLFPMLSQNAASEVRLEALALRLVWPDWLAELESTRFDNPVFVPAEFQDYTTGYAGNNAVLFAETVSVRAAPERFTWSGLFCDREAARFRVVATEAAQVLGLDLPADAARLLADQELAQQAFAAWDMIHDRTHNRGPLPFDPFMIKQRAPFWMYGLEELRCDVTAFAAAVNLAADATDGRLQEVGRHMQYAILFDRLFRFPVSSGRIRNYDSLAGQYLFAYLRRHGALRWTDNTLYIEWDRVPEVVALLRADIERLYHEGVDRPRLVHWSAAYELVAAQLPPHPGSVWAKGGDALDFGRSPRDLLAEVLPDEFPLSMFYVNLAKRLSGVIAATRGLTGANAGSAVAAGHASAEAGSPV